MGKGTLLMLPLEVGRPGEDLSVCSGWNEGRTMENPPVSSSESLVAPLSLDADFLCIGRRDALAGTWPSSGAFENGTINVRFSSFEGLD